MNDVKGCGSIKNKMLRVVFEFFKDFELSLLD